MKKISLIFSLFLLGACVSTTQKAPKMTQLQIRQFQTRSYDMKQSSRVLKATLAVLQDEGFIINSADSELGYLSASKELDVENKSEKFWANFLFGNKEWSKTAITECTANVSSFGQQTRVRVNFRYKILNNNGAVVRLQNILDPEYYQSFFAKVDKGLFIEKEKL